MLLSGEFGRPTPSALIAYTLNVSDSPSARPQKVTEGALTFARRLPSLDTTKYDSGPGP